MEQCVVKRLQGRDKSGAEVWSFRIPNSTNDFIELSTYGCSLLGLYVHDRDGRLQNLVRGMGELAEYEGAGRSCASLLGGSPLAECLARKNWTGAEEGDNFVFLTAACTPEESGLDGQAAEPRVIPLYLTPAAAGMVSPAFGEDFEYLEVEGDVPPQADFAVRLAGDSMEPYLMDGAVAYVNRDPLENGDVGIFFLDGDMLCKQYCRDTEGNVHLFSLNRSRADADRHIPAESGSTLCCYGRVILPQVPAPPLPEQSRGIL